MEQYVVATMIHPSGESDTLFIEPAEAIDDGCVALTAPMTWLEAIAAMEEMKAERDSEPWLPRRGGGA